MRTSILCVFASSMLITPLLHAARSRPSAPTAAVAKPNLVVFVTDASRERANNNTGADVGGALVVPPRDALFPAVQPARSAGSPESSRPAVASAGEAGRTILFGPANDFRRGELQSRQVTVSLAGEWLRLEAPATTDANADRRGLVFPLPENQHDLSQFRFIETEIANRGSAPVTFTFWALSGNGWGGVSTYSTAQNTEGRETLAAGARATFRIDLHAKYSGRQVYTTAVDPAAVRWLEIVLENERPASAVALELGAIRATGDGPGERLDTSQRVRVPDIVEGDPAPGRRIYQQLPGWKATAVKHVLTLPGEWFPGRKFPVLVEYTGNVFYHKFCHSTGYTDQGNLAYGLARGGQFICLNLPFISTDGKHEQIDGWGDIAKTEAYCLAALAFVEKNYGGDPRAVFYTGFSRGSYAANYLALRDDRIAGVWAGFLTLHDPGAAWPGKKERGWRGVDIGWDERAKRMQGRPWFHQDDELGKEVHVDVEFLEDRPSTVATRRWLQQQAQRAAIRP